MTRHHVSHHRHAHHPRHALHHGGKSAIHRAFDYTEHNIVAPVYRDIVRPGAQALIALPGEVVHTVDHTVSSPTFSIAVLAAIGVALFVVLK